MSNPASTPAMPDLVIRELTLDGDALAFRTLNEEWISLYFVLEEKDRQQLGHPETILAQGGHIYMAVLDGEQVGCVALVPMADGVYELSKMAVAPRVRGRGYGRALLLHSIAQARSLGARSLFLGSNTRLTTAVKLYESVGFRHLEPEERPNLAYSRANIFMQLALTD